MSVCVYDCVFVYACFLPVDVCESGLKLAFFFQELGRLCVPDGDTATSFLGSRHGNV